MSAIAAISTPGIREFTCISYVPRPPHPMRPILIRSFAPITRLAFTFEAALENALLASAAPAPNEPEEVEITFETDSVLPSPIPGNWLQAKAAGGVVRFVESQFDDQRTGAEIQRVFGHVKAVAFRAMSLRAIFLAIARKTEAA